MSYSLEPKPELVGETLKDSGLQVLRADAGGKLLADPDQAVPRPPFHWHTRVLVPGLVLGGFVFMLAWSAYQELSPGISVQASPVVRKALEGNMSGTVTVQATGWIEADPYKSYVTALADGVVREVSVLEGETVTKGQVVARLVDEDARLAVQRAEDKVKELEGALAAERAELEAARADWENPVERTRALNVAQAQLAESKATIEQVTAEIAVEESNLEHAKSQYDRASALHSSGAIAEQELIRLRSQYNAQRSKIGALRMRFVAVTELSAKNEADLHAAKEHMSLRTEDRRRLDRARASVIQAEAALNQGRTALAEAKLRLERMEIRAAMDGVVLSRLTEPGSKLIIMSDNPGSARVLAVYDPKRLQVRVDVPFADAAKISVGQRAEITVEVLPDRSFSGTVTRVLNEANIQKNTLEVKAALEDPDPQLRPEMLARVRFIAKIDPDAQKDAYRLFIPETAVHESGRGAVAWVVRDYDGKRGTVFSVAITPGSAKAEGWIETIDGMRPGDLVITSSVAELKNGKKVSVVQD